MLLLLHEYWEDEDGGEFSVVHERMDELRPRLMPNARLVFSLYASSWFEARQLEYDRLEYGRYPIPEGIPDQIYTTEQAAEQDAYLRRRPVGG